MSIIDGSVLTEVTCASISMTICADGQLVMLAHANSVSIGGRRLTAFALPVVSLRGHIPSRSLESRAPWSLSFPLASTHRDASGIAPYPGPGRCL